jgi:glycine/D-amino acid oxidase-like deaminating enzyme
LTREYRDTSMKIYDWIVIGAGITGAALAYELKQQGFSVLLLEQHAALQGGTRYSYGGISYWAGTTALTQTLCAEGIAIHRSLSEQLEAPTGFREIDLLLTVAPDQEPATLAATFAACAIPPQILDLDSALDREPLLNRAAIGAALLLPHAQIDPMLITSAYVQAFEGLGGSYQVAQVTELLHSGEKVLGVTTTKGEDIQGGQIAVCAGAWSRDLVARSGLTVPQYFTVSESIETPSLEPLLRTLVMPAVTQRFTLEGAASKPERAQLWSEPGHEPAPPILDAGAVQFADGRVAIGQISRTLTDRAATGDPVASETWLRAQISEILPKLAHLPGTWVTCRVAFSRDGLPLVGELPGLAGVHLFSGFSNPMAIIPPLARRFAAHLAGEPDGLIGELSPDRFGPASSPEPAEHA